MSSTNNAPYDRVDAAYIFTGLLDSYRAAVDAEGDTGPMSELIEHHSGECHLFGHMFETAIHASQAISLIVDFDKADLGMFAYDHLDSTEPGSLIHAVWINCILEHACPADIVALYVNSKGWPRLDSPAPVKNRFGAEVVTATELPVASIQVQTTIQRGSEVEACASDDNEATHWSVYTRNTAGLAEWVADYGINRNAASAKSRAFLKAARLSQKHGVPIEPTK